LRNDQRAALPTSLAGLFHVLLFLAETFEVTPGT
jgi:hypothetical protein